MQTYLKTKPVWMQLLQFLAFVFGSFFLIGFIGLVLSSLISGVPLLDAQNIAASKAPVSSRTLFMRGMLLTQFLTFIIPVFIFAKLSDKSPKTYLGLRAPDNAVFWIVGIVSLFAALPLVEYTGVLNSKVNFGQSINSWMQGKENEARTQINFLLSDRTLNNLILNVIFIALFAGIGEELVFRGVIQRLVIKGTKSPWIGILIAAFLFSFIHFQFFGFIPRFILGILLGAIYWYSGSLWPAIAAHFIYDALLIVLAYFNPKMITDSDTPMIETSHLWVGALISAALVGGLLWWMKKNSANSYERVYAGDRMETQDFTF